MKSFIIKTTAALGLLGASAIAMASSMDCCNGVECCMRMLSCCF